MINKQSMWFLTLFSLVLVLGVYYITMPNEFLSGTVTKDNMTKEVNASVTEGDKLVALRANRSEEVESEKEKLETILTKEDATPEEKNSAFEELKLLNLNVTKENELESKLESEFGIKSYIEINKDNIKVVINSKEHDASLANNIMRCIQKEYKEKNKLTDVSDSRADGLTTSADSLLVRNWQDILAIYVYEQSQEGNTEFTLDSSAKDELAKIFAEMNPVVRDETEQDKVTYGNLHINYYIKKKALHMFLMETITLTIILNRIIFLRKIGQYLRNM